MIWHLIRTELKAEARAALDDDGEDDGDDGDS